MRCLMCKRKIQDGAQVIPVLRFVSNRKVQEAPVNGPKDYIHLRCVMSVEDLP